MNEFSQLQHSLLLWPLLVPSLCKTCQHISSLSTPVPSLEPTVEGENWFLKVLLWSSHTRTHTHTHTHTHARTHAHTHTHTHTHTSFFRSVFGSFELHQKTWVVTIETVGPGVKSVDPANGCRLLFPLLFPSLLFGFFHLPFFQISE